MYTHRVIAACLITHTFRCASTITFSGEQTEQRNHAGLGYLLDA